MPEPEFLFLNAMTTELCAYSVDACRVASRAGVTRVELCASPWEGGTTPSAATIRRARLVPCIGLQVMIRPRGGDFCYTDEEFQVMKEDVKIFREEGIFSVVFGILTPDGRIDEERNAELIELARPMKVTFHRAFDMTRDAEESLETLIRLKVDRVLTSGLEPSVLEGMFTLKKLVEIAGDRIIVMPGAGINHRNFRYIRDNIGAKEYHVHPTYRKESKMIYRPGHIFMGGTLRQSEYALTSTPVDGVARYLEL